LSDPTVIASEAKQSSFSSDGWIASSLTLLAMTKLRPFDQIVFVRTI